MQFAAECSFTEVLNECAANEDLKKQMNDDDVNGMQHRDQFFDLAGLKDDEYRRKFRQRLSITIRSWTKKSMSNADPH
ncbi:hypothetical protein RB195_011283 [Necator americanus]|uniref:Uncharacterized protein n=1 Tax=Necator americanus TaxID=51031 RepID=A0ABR1D2N3_NECAM